ncbi:MAG: NADH-quinone oxidoreductase subunit N, partial [Alphaproteobacteria bacterium]
MLTETLSGSLSIIAPEVILGVGAMALLMLGVFLGEGSAKIVSALSVALVLVAGLWLVFATPTGVAFNGSFVLDPFARYMKLLVLLGSGAVIVMSVSFAEIERFHRFEFPVLLLLATIGMMLMVSAGDLIALYLGLELLSLASYVIAAFNRDNVRSTEAGLKYFILGALSSG